MNSMQVEYIPSDRDMMAVAIQHALDGIMMQLRSGVAWVPNKESNRICADFSPNSVLAGPDQSFFQLLQLLKSDRFSETEKAVMLRRAFYGSVTEFGNWLISKPDIPRSPR